MAEILTSGTYVPASSRAAYPLMEDTYFLGGWRSVETIDERDKIKSQRRKLGMAVYVLEDGITYTLLSGIENENWEPHPGLTVGKSAYEIALKYNPNIGTEEEWVASLKGATPVISVGEVTVASDDVPSVEAITDEQNNVKLNFALPSVGSKQIVNLLNNIHEFLSQNNFLVHLVSLEGVNGKGITIEGISSRDRLLVLYCGVALLQDVDYVIINNTIMFNNAPSSYQQPVNVNIFKYVNFVNTELPVESSSEQPDNISDNEASKDSNLESQNLINMNYIIDESEIDDTSYD